MMDVVHLDERWFYLTVNKRKYYLVNEEGYPYRTTKSKRFATKAMFLCAVARTHAGTRVLTIILMVK